MQKTLEYEQTILKKREDQMRQVEEDILDVNQIMKELNQMVNDQGANIGKLKNPGHSRRFSINQFFFLLL